MNFICGSQKWNRRLIEFHDSVSGLWAAGLYSTKHTVRTLCEYMGASRDALSMGTIEVKLSDIPEGKSITFTWRGKPLFVRHRVDSEISREEAVPLSELRDPQKDSVISKINITKRMVLFEFNFFSFQLLIRNVFKIQNG